jgi:hypothetical protein
VQELHDIVVGGVGDTDAGDRASDPYARKVCGRRVLAARLVHVALGAERLLCGGVLGPLVDDAADVPVEGRQ